MEFGYWPFKGVGEYIRWITAYLGLEVHEWNPKDKEEWEEKKKSYILKNPFINLPYLKDGETIIAESRAVVEALAFKAGRADLLGEGEMDKITVATLVGVLGDFRKGLQGAMTPDLEKMREGLEKNMEEVLRPKLEAFNKFLGDKEFLLGYVTIADFELAFYQEALATMAGAFGLQSVFEDFPLIQKMIKKLRSLPGLKEYFMTGAYIQRPLHPMMIQMQQQAPQEQVGETKEKVEGKGEEKKVNGEQEAKVQAVVQEEVKTEKVAPVKEE